jgi:hypothetical protein
MEHDDAAKVAVCLHHLCQMMMMISLQHQKALQKGPVTGCKRVGASLLRAPLLVVAATIPHFQSAPLCGLHTQHQLFCQQASLHAVKCMCRTTPAYACLLGPPLPAHACICLPLHASACLCLLNPALIASACSSGYAMMRCKRAAMAA